MAKNHKLKVGDKVVHILTNDLLEIKRISHVVATCILPESKWQHFATNIVIKNIVCLVSNLKPYPDSNPSPH